MVEAGKIVKEKPWPISKVLDSERLTDPLNDRQITSVRPPPMIPLSKDRLFPNDCENTEIDVELVRDYLVETGKISKECMLEILHRAKSIFNSEPNVVRTDGKVNIIGDIRGQFFDLVAMMRKLRKDDGED